MSLFQHTATRRWLHWRAPFAGCRYGFNTQPPEGGCKIKQPLTTQSFSFNTQPPEGGCYSNCWRVSSDLSFQHTATRRWLLGPLDNWLSIILFQHTATRRWLRRRFAAAVAHHRFNTQPPEGGCLLLIKGLAMTITVSTHSHPKVAAGGNSCDISFIVVSTHSHPKVAAFCPCRADP